MTKTLHRSAIIFFYLLFCMTTVAFAAKEQQPKSAYIEPTTKMEFVNIPGGTFDMGSNEDKSAQPVHQVTIKPFLLGRYEVTFEQYSKFCDATGRQIPPANGWGIEKRPVINVSWHDAVDFTRWLSEKSGKTFRLPSEAEWEYAAHGGTKTKYPWGDHIDKNQANCANCGSTFDGTSPVGSFAPNHYGLYDMAGNVYEWCLDSLNDTYTGAPTDGSAWLTGNNERKINRGGSWQRRDIDATVSRRCHDEASLKNSEIGFRVLLEQ